MTKSDEAVMYMISVWDEVLHKNWRDKPDHVQKKFIEAEPEAKKAQRAYWAKRRTTK